MAIGISEKMVKVINHFFAIMKLASGWMEKFGQRWMKISLGDDGFREQARICELEICG